MTTTKKKLNPNARKWVRALRSGKYKQTKSRLAKIVGGEPSFCCLGVACEVYRENGGRLSRKKVTVDRDLSVYIYGKEHEAALPERVQKWLGLRADMGDYNDGALYRENDRGTPFNQIADLIESQPEGLFK